MSWLRSSLYVRLALVFLLALGASFITMFFLFVAHLEESRNNNFVHMIATQVQLAEELLRIDQSFSPSKLINLKISHSPQPSAIPIDPELQRRLPTLQKQLNAELGRITRLMPEAQPSNGVWVNLNTPSNTPQWMFIALSSKHEPRLESLMFALIVGFLIFLTGGMLLLWQIQRPLKQLSQALASVGVNRQLALLPVQGGGETRILSDSYNQMVMRLQRYEEDRSTMLAGVAHDLRTPLTRLRLLMALTTTSRGTEIDNNLDDIERITNQFLEYARGVDEALESHDIRKLVADLALPYLSRGVETKTGPAPVFSSVYVNSLRRAIINLIENALEYGSLPIVLSTMKRDETMIIAIEDAGQGIPQDQIDYALSPFSRLDSARGGKGHCGLGLSIVAKIVESHHGNLTFFNHVHRGFVVEVRFPIIKNTLP